jgi:hypothetical protein
LDKLKTMDVRNIMHTSGERVSVIFNRFPYQPVLFPLLWITLDRRSKALSTMYGDLSALRSFYEYCRMLTFDLELAIMSCDFDSVLPYYSKFAVWIKSKTKPDRNSKARNTYFLESIEDYLGAGTVNGKLGSVKAYLTWCINRYSKAPPSQAVGVDHNSQPKDALKSILSEMYESHALPVKSKDKCEGIA